MSQLCDRNMCIGFILQHIPTQGECMKVNFYDTSGALLCQGVPLAEDADDSDTRQVVAPRLRGPPDAETAFS